jgi:hypothetical protein
VTTFGRPEERVGRLALEVLDESEVGLNRVRLVEVDIKLDDGTRDVLAKVGIVGREQGESLAVRLPGELWNVVCSQLGPA